MNKKLFDVVRVLNSLEMVRNVYGDGEFTRKQYDALRNANANTETYHCNGYSRNAWYSVKEHDTTMPATLTFDSFKGYDCVKHSRTENFDLPPVVIEKMCLDEDECYYYNGAQVSESEKRTLERLGFSVETKIETPVVKGNRYYYTTNGINATNYLSKLKRETESKLTQLNNELTELNETLDIINELLSED